MGTAKSSWNFNNVVLGYCSRHPRTILGLLVNAAVKKVHWYHMSSAHNHDDNDGSIRFGIILNSLYTIVEFGFGILTGSLALIADATHNLTDTVTLSISYVANRIARRSPDESKTFGYGRATILAALLNATIMLLVAGIIIYEAISRLFHPTPVEGGVVALVALVGVGVNGSIAYVLSKRRQDLNMKSAFVEMAFDALSSLAAVIAGLIMWLTGVAYIDSIVALLIASLLVYNVIKIFREAIQILLEGTPSNLQINDVALAIRKVNQVEKVDDLHIWSIRSGYFALSCHVVLASPNQPKDNEAVLAEIKNILRTEFSIAHTTIEVELSPCTDDEYTGAH